MRIRPPRRIIASLLACTVASFAGTAVGQGAHGSGAQGAGAAPGGLDTRTPEERNRARFPQPVRVGDLIGRQLLRNAPQQTVLGRVAGVTRGADGVEAILVNAGGVLGLGTRRVSVPAAATALLGQFIVLMDLDPAELGRLPEVRGEPGRLPPTETIRIGLTRN